MDNEYVLDYDEILKTVRTAEVITFRFVTVPERLLIDNRTNEVDGPLIKLVPRAASAEDRFKSLKQLRPRFKLPSKISAIWWPRYVRSLEESGIWEAIVKRAGDNGLPDAAACLDEILEDMRQKERAEVGNAIGGEGYRTLWPATR